MLLQAGATVDLQTKVKDCYYDSTLFICHLQFATDCVHCTLTTTQHSGPQEGQKTCPVHSQWLIQFNTTVDTAVFLSKQLQIWVQLNGDLHNSKGLLPFITCLPMLVILEWMFYHVVFLLLSTIQNIQYELVTVYLCVSYKHVWKNNVFLNCSIVPV